jgi:hypothetical protein
VGIRCEIKMQVWPANAWLTVRGNLSCRTAYTMSSDQAFTRLTGLIYLEKCLYNTSAVSRMMPQTREAYEEGKALFRERNIWELWVWHSLTLLVAVGKDNLLTVSTFLPMIFDRTSPIPIDSSCWSSGLTQGGEGVFMGPGSR